jgi:hypothetical protein
MTSRCAWLPPKRCACGRIARRRSTASAKSPVAKSWIARVACKPTSRRNPRLSSSFQRVLLREQQALGVGHTVGADEGHHRVHVVEGVDALGADGGPALGQRVPARTHRDAAQLQAPQDGRCVDHLEHDRRTCAQHALIHQRQHVVDLVQPEVEQRQVPPVVDREEAAVAPRLVVIAQPRHAVTAAVLHLHHMRDRVPAPAVARFEFDAAAPLPLGRGVVGAFLESEREHRQHRMVRGHAITPMRLRTRDAVAQHA